jgi:hypothetical protein
LAKNSLRERAILLLQQTTRKKSGAARYTTRDHSFSPQQDSVGGEAIQMPGTRG